MGLEEGKGCSILGVLVIQEGLGGFLRFLVLEELRECLVVVEGFLGVSGLRILEGMLVAMGCCFVLVLFLPGVELQLLRCLLHFLLLHSLLHFLILLLLILLLLGLAGVHWPAQQAESSVARCWSLGYWCH